jgi:hypothetical protein
VLASAKESELEIERREKEKEKMSEIGKEDIKSSVEKERVKMKTSGDDENIKEKESLKEKEKEKEKEESSPKSLKDQIGFLSALVKVRHCVMRLSMAVKCYVMYCL